MLHILKIRAQFTGALVTFLVICLLEAMAHTPLRIPNPPAVVIALIVYSGFRGGVPGGLASALIGLAYFAYFFALPGTFLQYSPDNLRRILVWTITAPATATMVGLLKKRLSERERCEAERKLTLAREQAAHEAARLQRDLLAAAVRLRDDFISYASHELKTPLTSMTLQTQMAIRRLASGAPADCSPERVLRVLKILERQIRQLARLVDSMLDIARIEKGGLTLHLQEVDLAALVNEVIVSLEDQLSAAGCTIRFHADTPRYAHVDRSRIEQLCTNLLTNALKYGAGAPIEVTLDGEGDRLELKVTDHGIGIAKCDQERIFNRFERAVPNSAISGLGLGLYLSKQIVLAHHGSIRVDSEPGAGATFVIDLSAGGAGS